MSPLSYQSSAQSVLPTHFLRAYSGVQVQIHTGKIRHAELRLSRPGLKKE